MQANSYKEQSTVGADSGRNRRQFLRFSLQPGTTALIEVERTIEVANIPTDRIVPMPHLPPAVRGVYNWRGKILWIVDLALLLGLGGATQRYRSVQPTIVLSSGGEADIFPRQQLSVSAAAELPGLKTIGFIVDEIVEIEWCELDATSGSLPADLHPALAQWVSGVWESPDGEDLLILDGQAILDRADAPSDLNYFFR
ncbi:MULTISPECIES: chemotaxis protein CheW [unclassified Chamaesiphon]|uniref:chemotaxis protein CheW n=1 Tax=unclassified Chamaesiphon TaxID=2620921 RepID=UPI00286CE8C9|nr:MULTISPECIES: chemotaxis protein CheW [unclassified Chamaesiphon]